MSLGYTCYTPNHYPLDVPISKDIIRKTLASPQGEQAYKIVEALQDAGFDAWWVGGCVRDMLLGKITDDIDIASDAHPDAVLKLFPRSNARSKDFGSVFVRTGGMIFHVTTFREDDEISDGRHPESVVFGRREKDAARRDITVNALYWQPISGDLYDPFGGEKDLKERLIRFIGDPAVKIKHDSLRLMRAVRFRAALEGQYHPDTYQAIRELAPLIEVLSGTRRLEELEKMLMGPHPDRALEDLWELGILQYVLPELHACKGIPQPADYHHEGDVWDHMMKAVRSFLPDHGIDVRLAALFHDCGKTKTFALKERIRFDEHASVSRDLTKTALDRLQCSSKRRDKICWMIEHHMMMTSFGEMTDARKAHWYYHPWFPELQQLYYLDIAGTDPSNFSLYEEVLRDYNRYLDAHPRPPKPFLSGEDVMEILGIPPGERVGEILKVLHEAQTSGSITTKKQALDIVKSYGKSR